jgi:hypothetical protein
MLDTWIRAIECKELRACASAFAMGKHSLTVASLSGARRFLGEKVLNLQSPQCFGTSHDIVATRSSVLVHSHQDGVVCEGRVGWPRESCRRRGDLSHLSGVCFFRRCRHLRGAAPSSVGVRAPGGVCWRVCHFFSPRLSPGGTWFSPGFSTSLTLSFDFVSRPFFCCEGPRPRLDWAWYPIKNAVWGADAIPVFIACQRAF